MARPSAEEVIEALRLKPLPVEGGWFRVNYRLVDALSSDDEHPAATAIYYMITPDAFSSLHRLKADELFHFYLGDACEMFQFNESGVVTRLTLGQDIIAGERPQQLVPAGTWQATRLCSGGKWALLGTTMTPGYADDGFEIATPDVLEHLQAEDRAMLRDLIALPE